ncbi:hypothetical protein MAR_017088 [Mya arenaria]|uniref:Uncharacterized protein n=1 Tax=Mya arenaria TaxID=6604 RepID=A0ABY7EAR4_MYAAR|nr:hypothetical protein MAR_017088 [Mya arenaria]
MRTPHPVSELCLLHIYEPGSARQTLTNNLVPNVDVGDASTHLLYNTRYVLATRGPADDQK